MDFHSLRKQLLEFRMDEITEIYAKQLNRFSPQLSINFEVAKSHERELKRRLVLVAIYPDAEYIMVSTIDDLWHAFILFSKKYSDFSSQIIGRFIHHQSLIHREDIDF
jgi:hypothetical protein